MAQIYKRKDGPKGWRAVVRMRGYPTVCDMFERKQEAEDWAYETEREIKLGQFNFEQHRRPRSFQDLASRFISDGALELHRSKEDCKRHLDYWLIRLGSYGLRHISTELIGKEREVLLNTPTAKGRKRSAATVNRYMASLSAMFTHAVRMLRWVRDNPCTYLKKLSEGPGRDRVLTDDEITRLLLASRESRSPYLHCIILISLTTGARQGEILNLQWRDIDFENKLAFLRETKNGRPRSIALAEPVLEELKRLHTQCNPTKPLVFAGKTTLGRIDIKKAWQQALKRAGIANCRAHDMRHTYCTLAARHGASNLKLAAATGHRTLEMLQRYTHLGAEDTREFSDRIALRILEKAVTDPLAQPNRTFK